VRAGPRASAMWLGVGYCVQAAGLRHTSGRPTRRSSARCFRRARADGCGACAGRRGRRAGVGLPRPAPQPGVAVLSFDGGSAQCRLMRGARLAAVILGDLHHAAGSTSAPQFPGAHADRRCTSCAVVPWTALVAAMDGRALTAPVASFPWAARAVPRHRRLGGNRVAAGDRNKPRCRRRPPRSSTRWSRCGRACSR